MAYTAEGFVRGIDYAMWSVKVRRSQDNKIYWVDIWVDHYYKDVEADWTQYIFNLENSDDMERREIQIINEEFDEATSEAICYLEQQLEIVQDDNGDWYCNSSEVNWRNA